MPSRPSPEARLLAAVARAHETMDKARRHARQAEANYRASLKAAAEGGVTLTVLARQEQTSWARISERIARANAETRAARTKGNGTA